MGTLKEVHIVNYIKTIPEKMTVHKKYCQIQGETSNVVGINEIPISAQASACYQEVAPSYLPINPYTGYPVSLAVADKSYVDFWMKMEEERNKAQLDYQKQMLAHDNKKELEKLKTENIIKIENKRHENAMKRQEGMCERTEERENAAFALFKDSEGRIRIETKYPTREPKYSAPIIKCLNVCSCKICDAETHEVALLIVSADNMVGNIILEKENFNLKGLENCLSKHGIALNISRERKKMVLSLLLSYLIDEAGIVELPKTLGWSKSNGGWIFASSIEETIDGAKGGYYGNK